MLNVIGSENVAPGVVEQSLLFQWPDSQPKLLIVRSTVPRRRFEPAKLTWSPASEVDVASQPWLGMFPGRRAGMLSSIAAVLAKAVAGAAATVTATADGSPPRRAAVLIIAVKRV